MEADRPAWNFFEDILPPEVTMGVFSFLELEDVVYVALVCKTWSTYFDTRNIWKQIYEKKFGQRDEKTVNLEQNVRWKRLFLQASNLNQKWKRDFMRAQRTFRCNAYSSDQFAIANRYHGIITTECVALVDTKLAGKIVQVKHNPVTCYHHNSTGINAVTAMIKSLHDPKPPKEDVYNVPRFYSAVNSISRINARGDFLLRELGNRLGIWNAENHVLGQGKANNTMIKLTPPEEGNFTWCINSKFAAFNNRWAKTYDSHIIDLSKKCSHCSVATLKNGDYVPETFPNACQGFGRSPGCAIIERLNGPFDWMYASVYNPNILVMAYFNRMMIWKHGEPSIELKLPEVKSISNWGEHFVEGKGHWLTYSTTYSPNMYKTTFMDLNNVNNKIDMPFLSKYLFVPKKSKVLCVVKDKIIAYDLDQKTWLSKIQLTKPVRAMTFSKSTAVLFVATEDHVYAYQWETAQLLSFMEHQVREVIAIHLMLDQVLVISAQDRHEYFKIMTKLDF